MALHQRVGRLAQTVGGHGDCARGRDEALGPLAVLARVVGPLTDLAQRGGGRGLDGRYTARTVRLGRAGRGVRLTGDGTMAVSRWACLSVVEAAAGGSGGRHAHGTRDTRQSTVGTWTVTGGQYHSVQRRRGTSDSCRRTVSSHAQLAKSSCPVRQFNRTPEHAPTANSPNHYHSRSLA